ncbi:hypothetical protein EK21DRAFT_75034 [Setomelanomma holmii]|uniref:Pentatricopeptide repeat-containing protein n=1 Tax=Setomelanomma holmii TaxID=210430 RepID=A0A9P4H0H1_9PLEO|nr:hypothetical protein EK21DRAFT_75034 [Setomelanomma holmii]
MQSAGKYGLASQRAEYLECVFLSGAQEAALDEWEKSLADMKQDPFQQLIPEYFETGARLYALADNPDRARQHMDQLFESNPRWRRTVMLTVLRAHTSSQDDKHRHAAQGIYNQLKERKGSEMNLQDYDACLVGFLEARDLRLAKQVFRDMIKAGYLATTGTEESVEEVLKRLHSLYRLGTDISAMTSIALDSITVLPLAYHAHIFGDWMKSAVTQQAPEAAAQILDMMIQRGHEPETFHFNMLLEALLRTKEDPSILKAENIGWRMIDEARKSNKMDEKMPSTATQISLKFALPRQADSGTPSTVPAADVTTFALVMHHHGKKLQWEHVDYLSRQFRDSAVKPNTTIMNVLIDNKCRQGAYAEAWQIYQKLTKRDVFPNGATFRHLWKTLRLALSDHATRNDPNLPTPRELLKETNEWWTMCRSRYDAERFRIGLAGSDHGAITALIMHCFSYTSDLAGSLVALHVLRHRFDIFPTDKAAEYLQRQMAWVDMARESESKRYEYFHSRSNKRNTERIARVYGILLQRRLDRMRLAEDYDPESMTDEEIGDVGLNLLSEFVRVVLKRSYPPEVVEAMIDAAKAVVGVEGMTTGDMDAFEVA